jgi:threonine dehydrogenase-like Zn-dependent dehydrogenase
MRDYIVMPWQKVIAAEGISQRDIALVEPMSVGFHAVNRAEVIDTDVVMVIGCGMIGMGAIVRAAMRGATVVAVDVDDEKLQIAQQVGATYTVNSMKENLHERIQQITEGLGVDAVIEAVGNAITQRQAIDEVAFTGRVTFIGYAPTETSFLTKLFVQKELDVRGSRNAKPSDFRAVIHFMQTHPEFPTDQLVSAVVTPADAPQAMQKWHEAPAKVFRILVKF